MTVTQADAVYVRELVRSESAIVLDQSKDYLIEARLNPLAREAGLASIGELVRQLKAGSRDLKVSVIEAMTTNETSFFRDVRPFDTLRTNVIPQLVRARANTKTLRFWSAAASTGQEAYSIAMTVKDTEPLTSGWTTRIHGTDIARSVLAQAREGRYGQLEVNRGLPVKKLTRWFTRDGGSWYVKPELKSMVTFDQLNLITPWSGSAGQYDVIFLRNVLIYFDVETKRQILDKVKRVLAPDGYLFLGTAEMMNGVHTGFRLERDDLSVWFRPV